MGAARRKHHRAIVCPCGAMLEGRVFKNSLHAGGLLSKIGMYMRSAPHSIEFFVTSALNTWWDAHRAHIDQCPDCKTAVGRHLHGGGGSCCLRARLLGKMDDFGTYFLHCSLWIPPRPL